jgi:hypothetical protein
MMTGDERYLSAAEAGTAYLREHFLPPTARMTSAIGIMRST